MKHNLKGKEEIDNSEINSYCRNFGIVIIILGIIHFIASQSLDASWGVLLILVGIFALLFRKRSTIIIFGITLVIVGFMNILTNIFENYSSNNIKWLIFGIFQFYWGITEFIKYKKVKESIKNERYNRAIYKSNRRRSKTFFEYKICL
jgi:membrane-bound ClpP family serine protease